MSKIRNYPWYEATPISDLRDMLLKSASRFGCGGAFLNKVGAGIEAVTYKDLKDQVFALGAGLFDLGFGRGRKAAIYSEGRWEWGLSYLAVVCGNGVNIPVDKDLRLDDIRHILAESETEIALTSARYLENLLELRGKLACLKQIVCFDGDDLPEGVLSLSAVMERGKRLLKRGESEYADLKIDPQQPATIVYTSGTMGSAKGVVLSQHNLISNMMDMCRAVYIDEKDTLLSVLPLNHTYECTCGLLTALYRGSSVSYCDNFRHIASQMQEVRATIMLGVPLLFEAISRKIMEGIREKGVRKFKAGKAIASLSQFFLGIRARRLVFSSVHRKFGGRLRLLISGGAASDPEVAALFQDLGITFLQGYGLTECGPILAVNRPDALKNNAAGLPLPSVEIRIAEDGEICARGPNIMSGYYKKPEASAEVLRDGWFHTGDLGYFDEDNFLYIHGRKKAVIVLSNGKNVYAEEIESCLNRSPFVLESLAWEGPDTPSGKIEEVYATIVPNREEFDRYFTGKGLETNNQVIEEVLRKEIREQCAGLPTYKRVRRFAIRWEEFDKTTTRKIKRYLYTEKTKNA